jgi:hypothetical protein
LKNDGYIAIAIAINISFFISKKIIVFFYPSTIAPFKAHARFMCQLLKCPDWYCIDEQEAMQTYCYHKSNHNAQESQYRDNNDKDNSS